MSAGTQRCVLALLLACSEAAAHAAESALPPVTHEGSAALSQQPAFVLKSVVLEGSTVLDQAAVADEVRPFLGEATIDDLRELQVRLSRLYADAGYINSGVVIPDQPITDGRVTLKAVEGALTAVNYQGYEPRRRSTIRRQLDGLSTPFNLNELQNLLQMIERSPVVDRVNGRLRPGTALGDATLDLAIARATPYRVSLLFDNHRSPSIGAEAATVVAEHFDLTGADDHLTLSLTGSEGQVDGFVRYQRPLFGTATTVGVFYQNGASDVVEAEFDPLDIENDAESWGVDVSHHLVARVNRQIDAFVGLAATRSETELLSEPFSFSLGADDGESTSVTVNAGVSWTERRSDDVIAARIAVRRGIDAFGATIAADKAVDRSSGAELPDGEFTAVVTQVEYARRLPLFDSQLVIGATWQKAFDPLLSVEKIAIGGADSVRGYRENQLVRDQGVVAHLEWHVPLGIDARGIDRWHLTVVPFFDYGRARDHDDHLRTGEATKLRSVGLGAIWEPAPWFGADVSWGYALDDDEFPVPEDRDLQDHGWHFSLRFSYPFRR